ncbi:hypothetical protein [Agrobacterium tumefaciens]|uniref:hypothetical protein n=1 Tax=Agrobacterium tumefaciens TaxID=358 RepID=UPI001572D265|nr:hypothetical protein [Agrobacterium tumefaciens]NTD85482.1 hypothetical protein [Agrobacterium tumefaciens]NTD90831.1 hypothetical protein [Agrobacterium tumefaciens]NTE03653.1 hypothetical protein [Agrobacterium tumefaciens]NTE15905.1 hypothetical protein [Agrobacterium tumefaciens]NTE26479.1 hypothetical protein [Agrobacterium tumefaciens]
MTRTKKPPAPAKSSTRSAKPLKTKADKADEKMAVHELVVNQTQMAAVLGVSTRWLRDRVTEGVVPTEGRGRFNIGEVVQAYIAYSKEGAIKKTGTESLDDLRKEKALDIRLARARKDREVIALDEAVSAVEELTGMYVASLSGLPAQITGVPRERQRLNDIFDAERLRLTDRFTKRIATLRTGEEDPDTEAED